MPARSMTCGRGQRMERPAHSVGTRQSRSRAGKCSEPPPDDGGGRQEAGMTSTVDGRSPGLALPKSELLEMYRRMVLIRRFEEAAA